MDKDEKMDKVLGLKGKCSSYYLSKITGIPTTTGSFRSRMLILAA